ncbi:type I-E CRISPR-associated protein Cse1/CasA [Leptolyngbya sp. 'hensonii']|uniref:type I-E CRISPR-associated protein Cse1/CasA n=1 Tax=Leptolyngbya sp. 'hensonii' TaxID=1922337 RepID=UPI00094F5CB9|nr:type I-E CRISPR-associated protein Cse1/CasA [Leptolyngbya sp. 'hensonii']OLP18283.1 type I-E CRISPR-associated protein Cse1/CasA [Leptolyngbya sp. 'hensonii']
MSFNLTQEPWIPIVSQDWQYKEVSLIELFQSWGELREIQADNPPTTLALYRLLLALLHHVYQGPENEDRWEEIQDDDGEQAIAYLQEKQELFDLLHPDRPFLQDSTLTQEMAGEIYQAYMLHGNNTSTVFCHEHQWSGNTLSIPAAARLVLRLHLFDVGGRKTGSPISAGVIPTMDAANVLVRGKTLKETLLLNLMQYDGKEKPCVVTGEDLPAWERDNSPASERIPSGYIDYLTYQWRRVRLFVDGNQAVQVAFHAGDRLPKDLPPSGYECGIAYVKNPKGLFTVRLNLNRSLWRDSAAFLQSSDAGNCPRIITWLAELKTEKLIDNYLNLQVLGLTVDNAKPLGWTSEQFSAPIAYLKEKPLWQSLVVALQTAEDHQQVFRSFQGSPYHALAKELNHPDAGSFAKSLDGESRYWATLDRMFQVLLEELPADKTKDGNGITYGNTKLPEWTKTVQTSAREAFTDSILAIRNYQARAVALRVLEWKLLDLRSTPEQKADRKAKATAKKKEKVSK